MTAPISGASAPWITNAHRLEELHRHPAPPPGLEVHDGGLRHEVQKGDSAWGIARDYSQAYHMDISPTSLIAENRDAFKDGLHPGELLVVPGIQERFDTMIGAEGKHEDPFTYVVQRGDTLSRIARNMSAEFGRTITWPELHEANRDVIGNDPNRIMPGQELVVPGTGTEGYEVPPLQTLSDIDGDVVLTRTGRVQHEAGGIEQIDVMRFTAVGSHAEQHASVADAIRAARAALDGGEAKSPIAIVQVRDGSAWTVPVRGEEADNLDHTDRVMSLAYRADEREVVAVVDQPWEQPTRVRRFDQ